MADLKIKSISSIKILNKRSFERELKPCLYVFQFLGLQQFSISGLSKGIKTSGRSCVYTFCFIAQLVFFVGFFLVYNYYFPFRIKPRSSVGTTISILLDFVAVLLFFVETICLLISACVTTNSQYRVFLSFFDILNEFSEKMEVIVDYRKFKKTFRKLCFVFIFMYLLEFIVIFYNDGDIEYQIWFFIVQAVAALVSMTNNLVGLLHIFYTELLNFHFKILRETLMRSIDTKDQLKTIYNAKVPIKLIETRNDFYKFLSNVKHTHLSLWKTCKQIDECIGKTVSIFLFQLAFSLLNHGYRCFMELVSDANINFYYSIAVISFAFVSLILVVRSSEKPGNEVMKLQVSKSRPNLKIFTFIGPKNCNNSQ